MDLNSVISELRSELEAVKQITAALEKLYEIRKSREMQSGEQVVLEAEENQIEPKASSKKRKNAAEQASAQG